LNAELPGLTHSSLGRRQALGTLAALTSLSAQHNKISQLPDEIGTLSQLRNLKLHDNQIEHLPATFGQLVRVWTTEHSFCACV
jgi:Leucine-rich repeat (LRR) protein